MNIISYIKSLLPSFKRSAVETDARNLLTMVKKNVLQSFKKLAAVMAGKPFTSELGKRVEADIRRAAGVTNNVTATDLLLQLFTQLPAKLEYIIGLIDEEFEPDVSRDNMTYKQSTIVRFLELVRFGLDYSMRMGSRLVVAEARLSQGRANEIDAQLTPNERKWFDANYRAWLQVVGLMFTPLVKLRSAIEKMPDVVINEHTAAADVQAIGGHRLDPLQMGFIGNTSSMTWNPIYHVRMMLAEIQVEMLKAQEKEVIVLELQILDLQNGPNQDPKVQQQIEYHTGRLQTLRYKIEQTKERYGLT